MNKKIFFFSLIVAVNSLGQSSTPNNTWGPPKFLGFNTSNGVNPLFIKTNDITRMQINGITSGFGVNTSGFIGIGTNNPAAPIHIFGTQIANAQTWMRGITLSNQSILHFDGGAGANHYFMGHSTGAPVGNWFAGGASNLTSSAAVNYAQEVFATTTPA